MNQCFLKRLLFILIKNKKKRLTFLSRRDYSSKVITFKIGFIHLKHCKISTNYNLDSYSESNFFVPYFSVLSHRHSTERFFTLMERMNQAYQMNGVLSKAFCNQHSSHSDVVTADLLTPVGTLL